MFEVKGNILKEINGDVLFTVIYILAFKQGSPLVFLTSN